MYWSCIDLKLLIEYILLSVLENYETYYHIYIYIYYIYLEIISFFANNWTHLYFYFFPAILALRYASAGINKYKMFMSIIMMKIIKSSNWKCYPVN